MKLSIFDFIVIFIALTSGNYFYQSCLATIPNYSAAFERSFFQGIACIAIYFLQWMKSKTN